MAAHKTNNQIRYSPEIAALQHKLLRQTFKILALSGWCERNPDNAVQMLRCRLADLIFGLAIYRCVYDPPIVKNSREQWSEIWQVDP